MTQARGQRPRPRVARSRRGTSLLRLRVAFVLIAMVVSVFGVRLFQIQGIDAAAYVARAEAEGVVTVDLPAERGSITDRNGVPLAQSVDGLMVVADPKLTVVNASEIATILARRLSVDYFATLARLRKPDTRFQYLARRVPSTLARDVVAEIDTAGYDGVDTRRDPVRDYPAKDVGANLVGFLNDEGDAAEGAELMFDRILSGTPGSTTYEVGGGNRIPLGENEIVAPKPGRDVALTIDRDLQWYVQRVLRTTVQNAGGASGSAIVLDTDTGEALALADYPSFDPNDPGLTSDETLFSSASLRDAYEPGSVQKVLTMAALLDQGAVTPRTRLVVPPQLERYGEVIHDYYEHPRLRLTLTGVVAKSSNIGTVEAADEISSRALHRYLRSFGLGSPTGVGLDGESAGVLTPWRSWIPINKDTISFGQGVAVSALQMAAAVNTVANGGVYVQPSIVQGTHTTSGGAVIGSAEAETHRVISEKAARQTTTMMEAVTDADEGTAPSAGIAGYRVAGKTGTAQRVDNECGCYDDTTTVSFAGFAPADDPQFAVYVVVQDPRKGSGGGSVGGPAFRKIMSHLLQQYAVPPTGSVAPTPHIEW